MNRIGLAIVFSLYVISLNAQPLSFRLRPLEGYFLNDNIKLKRGLNFFVISDRNAFFRYFGQINKADTPRFRFEHIIVMALPPSKRSAQIAFMPKASKAGNFIEIYCTAEKTGMSLTYMSYPIVVAAIPRYFSVTKINFYDAENNNKLLETVDIR